MYYYLLLSFCFIGQSYGQTQDTIKKKQSIDSLLIVVESTSDDTVKAWSYYRLAKLYRDTESEEEYSLGNNMAKQCHTFSKATLRKSIGSETEHSLHVLLGKVSRLLINTYSWFQENEQLEIYFNDCIAHNDTIRNISEKCKCIRDFGRYYMVNGRQVLGRTYYDKVIEIERKANDSVGLSTSLASLANLYWRNGDMVNARLFISESIDILTDIGDLKTVTMMLNQLGLICSTEGKYFEASTHFYRALDIADSFGNKEGVAYSLNNLGLLFVRHENYDKALGFSKKSLEISKDANDKRGMSFAYNQVATVYASLKEFDKALINYQNCLKILNDFGRREDIARLKLNISSTYLKLDSLDKAKLLYEEIFEIIDQIKNKSMLIQAKIGRGELLYKQGEINAALQEAKEGAGLLQIVNDINESRKVEKLLSRIYEKKGEWRSSLIHFKKYITLNDSIKSTKTLRKMIYKESEYRINRNQDSTSMTILLKENEILENENLINSLKHEEKVKNLIIYGVFIGAFLLLAIAFLWLWSYKKDKELKEVEMHKEINLNIKEIDFLQSSLKAQSKQRAVLKTSVLDGSINEFLSIPLSNRELEVLVELTKGRANKVIADNLFVSINTVRTHLSSIYEKLEVKNRMQAVNKASNLKSKFVGG